MNPDSVWIWLPGDRYERVEQVERLLVCPGTFSSW